MGLSITRLIQSINASNLDEIDGVFHEIGYNEYEGIAGIFDGVPIKCLPIYDAGSNKWYGSDNSDIDEEKMDFSVQFNPKGIVFFLEDYGDPTDALRINSFHEFLQYYKNLGAFTQDTLDVPVKFKEFPLNEVFEDVYISLNYNAEETIPVESFRFAKRSDLETILGKEKMASLLDCILNKNFEFLTEIENWSKFCEEKGLLEKLETTSAAEIPLFYYNEVLSNCDSALIETLPYAGFKLKESFSAQYFYDYLTTSSEGDELLKTLMKELLSGEIPANLTVMAPDSLVSQIRYSIELRNQKQFLKGNFDRIIPSKPAPVTDLKSRLQKRNESLGKFITGYLEDNKD